MFKCLSNLFKRKYPKILDQVNKDVNRRIVYESDLNLYNKEDLWVNQPDSNKGDCEDYALTKRTELLSKGIPAADLKVAINFFFNEVTKKKEAHAVLLYKDEWVLDNFTDVIWRKDQTKYFDWRLNFKEKPIANGKPK